MEITAETEIAAPRDFVLARVADFESHERRAAERGLEFERLGPPQGREGPPGVGTAWRLVVDAMGGRRVTVLRVKAMGPDGLDIVAEIAGVTGDVRIGLEPLGPVGTRMRMRGVFTAGGMGARLALGSLRLAQGEIERRLADRLAAFAERIGREWADERAAAAG